MPSDKIENVNPLVIQYGDFSLDFGTMPQTSLVAMLRRGVSHYFGSEQASKVKALVDKGPDNEGIADTAEARQAAKTDFQKKAYDALLAGTVGTASRGPSIDPVEKVMRRIARKEVTNILKQNGVKPPKKADDTITLPDNTKVTMNDLIDRRIEKEGERIAKEADKELAAKAREAKKAAEAAAGTGLNEL